MANIDSFNLFRRIIAHPLFLIIIGFFLILTAMVLPQIIGQILTPVRGRPDGIDLLISIAAAALTVAVYWLFTRYIERKPNRDFALDGAPREWASGAFLGFAAMSVTIGIIALLGGYRITGHNSPEVLTAVLSMAIVSGITEEILLRGVVFRLLEQWLGSVAALAMSAALFGALHIGNPNSSWFAAFAIAVEAGILLGAIYMLTRRLWAAIGLHMAWNATQGGLFGVKVSGTDVEGLLTSETSGSALISGGAFGAEASIPALIVCTALGLTILWRARAKGHFIRASRARFRYGGDHPGTR